MTNAHAALFPKSVYGICMAILIVAGGCGPKGIERTGVSGTVTYMGQPIKMGEIRFIPDKGPVWAAPIVDGKYFASGKGVTAGTLRVEIRGYRPKANAPTNLPGIVPEDIPKEQILPRKFNIDSQIELVIESGSGLVTKDFDLTD